MQEITWKIVSNIKPPDFLWSEDLEVSKSKKLDYYKKKMTKHTTKQSNGEINNLENRSYNHQMP